MASSILSKTSNFQIDLFGPQMGHYHPGLMDLGVMTLHSLKLQNWSLHNRCLGHSKKRKSYHSVGDTIGIL